MVGLCCYTEAFSSCGEQGLLLRGTGFSLPGLLLWGVGSRLTGSAIVPDGSAAPLYGGSSPKRDQTGIPCIVMWSLYH